MLVSAKHQHGLATGMWLPPSPHSGFCSIDIFSEAVLATLPKIPAPALSLPAHFFFTVCLHLT